MGLSDQRTLEPGHPPPGPLHLGDMAGHPAHKPRAHLGARADRSRPGVSSRLSATARARRCGDNVFPPAGVTGAQGVRAPVPRLHGGRGAPAQKPHRGAQHSGGSVGAFPCPPSQMAQLIVLVAAAPHASAGWFRIVREQTITSECVAVCVCALAGSGRTLCSQGRVCLQQ